MNLGMLSFRKDNIQKIEHSEETFEHIFWVENRSSTASKNFLDHLFLLFLLLSFLDFLISLYSPSFSPPFPFILYLTVQLLDFAKDCVRLQEGKYDWEKHLQIFCQCRKLCVYFYFCLKCFNFSSR